MEVALNEYEVAEDMQLDGLKIVQDTRLYRFTSDSVLLSKFAKAQVAFMQMFVKPIMDRVKQICFLNLK